MGQQVDQLIEMLQSSLEETLFVLSRLSDAELDDPSDHPCAMGGSVRDLLSHNIDHERMHVGQVYSARYGLRKMQKSEADRIMAETLRARAELIASLIGLPDDALDAHFSEDQWTVRQMIEHTLYWERHSIDHIAHEKLGRRLPAERPRASLDIADPISGKLHPDGQSALHAEAAPRRNGRN